MTCAIVFGPESPHLTEERLFSVSTSILRSRSELALRSVSEPGGHVLTAWEAYQADDGLSALEEALEYGSAILLHSTP